jgi:hypothetical protein
MSRRPVKKLSHIKEVIEGVGVKLERDFDFGKESWKPRGDSASPQHGGFGT